MPITSIGGGGKSSKKHDFLRWFLVLFILRTLDTRNFEGSSVQKKNKKKQQRLAQPNDYDQEELEQRRPRPPRPIPKKKKMKEPCVEEDIIDGFTIMSFKTKAIIGNL